MHSELAPPFFKTLVWHWSSRGSFLQDTASRSGPVISFKRAFYTRPSLLSPRTPNFNDVLFLAPPGPMLMQDPVTTNASYFPKKLSPNFQNNFCPLIYINAKLVMVIHTITHSPSRNPVLTSQKTSQSFPNISSPQNVVLSQNTLSFIHWFLSPTVSACSHFAPNLAVPC